MRDPNHLERPSACTLRAPLRDTYKSLWETPITLRDQVHALWETHIHWQVCSWETNFILKGTLSFVGTPTVRDPPHALWVTPCMHFEEPIAFWWISNFDWHTAHCIVKMLLKGLWLLGWQNTKKCWADKPCCVQCHGQTGAWPISRSVWFAAGDHTILQGKWKQWHSHLTGTSAI